MNIKETATRALECGHNEPAPLTAEAAVKVLDEFGLLRPERSFRLDSVQGTFFARRRQNTGETPIQVAHRKGDRNAIVDIGVFDDIPVALLVSEKWLRDVAAAFLDAAEEIEGDKKK